MTLHPDKKEEGFSLVMSLIFISLLAVLVVGFLTSMKVEVSSAESHFQTAKAKYFADMGTDMAVARLRFATGSTTSIWISQPGQILSYSSTLTQTPSPTVVPLYSGAGVYADSADISADLNGGTNYYVTSRTDRIRVKWIYVHKDGSLEIPTTTPSYSLSNPIVGRLAYWTDDESSRVNLLTAYTRNSSTSQVNLAIFSPTFSSATINDLATYRANTNSHAFNTVNEARVVSTTMASFINADRFPITVNSRAPDLNMFGQPRIVLTTQRALADGKPFLDILQNDNTDPGVYSNLNTASVSTAIASISAMFTRTGWPYAASTASLGGKYLGTKDVRWPVLAMNIIEWVRAKESQTAIIEPLRGAVTATGSFTWSQDDGASVMGNNRGVRITEYKVDILNGADLTNATKTWTTSLNTTSGTVAITNYDLFRFVLTFEVHLSSYSGLSSVDLRTLTAVAAITPTPVANVYWNPAYLSTSTGVDPTNVPATPMSTTSAFVYFGDVIGGTNAQFITASCTNPTTPYLLTPGSYATIVTTMTSAFGMSDKVASPRSPRRRSDITSVGVDIALRNVSDSIRVEYAGGDGSYSTTYAQATGTEEAEHTNAVDDPYVNRSAGDWKKQTGSNMTFGSGPPSSLSSLGTTPLTTISCSQDTDASGKVTNSGCRFPAPAGTTSPPSGIAPNPYGVMESVAELGFVHTGTERTVSNTLGGVPYRTLHFRPTTNSSTLVPDWVLMDMFTVPTKRFASLSSRTTTVSMTTGYNQPSTGTYATAVMDGQININGATITPSFPLSGGTGAITRSDPLAAAIMGTYTTSLTTVTATATISAAASYTIAAAIRSATISSTYGSRFSMGSYYLSRGEIAEIKGMADGGEDDEQRLRGVVDYLTTRSNVFRVYSIGQVVAQASTGTITVLSEKRTMTLIERALDSTGTAVQYKTLYSGKPQ